MPITRTARAVTMATLIVGVTVATAGAATIWYSTETSDGFSHLYSLDSSTLQITDRGSIDGMTNLTDIAVGGDGTIYGVNWRNDKGAGNGHLYQITPGAADTPASFTELDMKSSKLQNGVSGLVWQDGTMWAASDNGKLQTLVFQDNAWQITNTGSINDNAEGDLAFFDGQLYATLSGGRLATLNTDPNSRDFGRATVVGSTGYEAITGLVAVGGGLYGFTNTADKHGDSYLVRLNPDNGTAIDAHFIGQGVWGAGAFYESIPEPAGVALISLGGAWIALRRRLTRN